MRVKEKIMAIDEKSLKNAQRVYNTLLEYLTEKDVEFYKDDENFMVAFGFCGEDIPIELRIKVYPEMDFIKCVSILSYEVPEDKIPGVVWAMNYINSKQVLGQFCYDFDLGRIVFSYASGYADCIVGKGIFDAIIGASATIVDMFNDRFLAFIKGMIGMDELFDVGGDDDEE